MSITLNTFINDFKNSGIIEQISNYYDIIFIWVTGSRAVNLNDSESDYDVGILVADHVEAPRDTGRMVVATYTKDNRKTVHLRVNTLKEVYSLPIDDPYGFYDYLGWAQFGLFDESHIIFINPKHQNIVNELIATKDVIARRGAYAFLTAFDSLLTVLADSKIPEGVHSKFIAYCLFCLNILSSSHNSHEQLLRIKRTAVEQLPEVDFIEIVARATEAKQHIMETFPPELQLKSFKPWW